MASLDFDCSADIKVMFAVLYMRTEIWGEVLDESRHSHLWPRSKPFLIGFRKHIPALVTDELYRALHSIGCVMSVPKDPPLNVEKRRTLVVDNV